MVGQAIAVHMFLFDFYSVKNFPIQATSNIPP
jgi:hypothetical protein